MHPSLSQHGTIGWHSKSQGWHYKMNSQLNGYHPGLFYCIQMFKKEQNGWENDASRIRSDLGEGTQNKYALLDKKIRRVKKIKIK